MSGIVGFVSNKENKSEIIKKMNDKIIHRGLDGEGFYVDENIALGHRLLKLTGSEKQPVRIDGYVIVLDGRILNTNELSKELKLKSNNELSVLIEGYKVWKEKLPTKLRGSFAFVIWDIKEKKLFGARDHFGIKPFYYYENNLFVFASEIKSILEYPDYVKEINTDILSSYLLVYFNPHEETFFKGIKTLPPGTSFIYENNKLSIHKYYEYEFKEEKYEKEEIIDLIEERIKESVSLNLDKEKNIGSFLSSGIDSSYLVCLAKPVKTYTIGYKEVEYSEISYAKDLSDKLNIENITRIVNKNEYLKIVPRVMYHLDEPIGDPATIGLYFASESASENHKVVTSGEGADEFFGGYGIYQDIYKLSIYNKIPFFMRKIFAKIALIFPEFKGKTFIVRKGQKIEDSYMGLNWVFNKKELKKILTIKPNDSFKAVTDNIFKRQLKKNDLIKMQVLDINLSLIKNFLVNGDKMGMANGIEVVAPFMDTKIFEVARILKKEDKVSKDNTKLVLREAAKRVIPNESYKKKKLGFPVPLREWIREDDYYQSIKKTFELDITKEFFNQQRIIKLLDDHRNRKKDNYKKIWTIYCFLLWYKEYFT